MKTKLVVLIAGIMALSATVTYGNDQSKMAGEARSIVKSFGGHLKSALVGAMKKGGPVNAIEVCSEVAIPITEQAGEKSGWHVARTSLKLRNTSNEPDEWERTILKAFEVKKAAGADPKKLEHFEVVSIKGKKIFRYMKAIPTGKPCLHCHGTELEAPVKEKLAEYYPLDKATGFQLGSIRGAFSLSKELK